MNPPDIRSLDIGMLRTFAALMQERSVSRAAGRLFLSQPAVSASLGRLRETFGDPLFARTGHGVTPTPRAQALAPQIDKLLADIAGLLETERPFDPATSSRIFRITGSDFPGRTVLPALGRTLADCGSGIRILWEPPGTWSLAERLHSGEVDLALVARIKPPQDMQALVLYEDCYVYALRRDHPRANESPSLDRFCEIPQIFLGYGTSMLDDLIDETLARQGRQRRARFAVTSFGQMLHQLQHGDDAAVLGRRVAQAYAEQLAIQPLPFELPHYRSLLCWGSRAGSDAGIQWLKAQVLSVYGMTG